MAFETLKTLINDNIKSGLPNGIRPEEEHNPVLQSIVTTLGSGYAYMGLATTGSSPLVDDVKRMYITSGYGTFTAFLDASSASIEVADRHISVIKGESGVWTQDIIVDLSDAAETPKYTDDVLNKLSKFEKKHTQQAVLSMDKTDNYAFNRTNLVNDITNGLDSIGVYYKEHEDAGTLDSFQEFFTVNMLVGNINSSNANMTNIMDVDSQVPSVNGNFIVDNGSSNFPYYNDGKNIVASLGGSTGGGWHGDKQFAFSSGMPMGMESPDEDYAQAYGIPTQRMNYQPTALTTATVFGHSGNYQHILASEAPKWDNNNITVANSESDNMLPQTTIESADWNLSGGASIASNQLTLGTSGTATIITDWAVSGSEYILRFKTDDADAVINIYAGGVVTAMDNVLPYHLDGTDRYHEIQFSFALESEYESRVSLQSQTGNAAVISELEWVKVEEKKDVYKQTPAMHSHNAYGITQGAKIDSSYQQWGGVSIETTAVSVNTLEVDGTYLIWDITTGDKFKISVPDKTTNIYTVDAITEILQVQLYVQSIQGHIIVGNTVINECGYHNFVVPTIQDGTGQAWVYGGDGNSKCVFDMGKSYVSYYKGATTNRYDGITLLQGASSILPQYTEFDAVQQDVFYSKDMMNLDWDEPEYNWFGSAVMSVLAKAGDLNHLVIGATDFDDADKTNPVVSANYQYFNLSNGTLGSSNNALNAGIQEMADGWYYCWVVYPQDSEAGGFSTIRLTQTNSDTATATPTFTTNEGADGITLAYPDYLPESLPRNILVSNSSTVNKLDSYGSDLYSEDYMVSEVLAQSWEGYTKNAEFYVYAEIDNPFVNVPEYHTARGIIVAEEAIFEDSIYISMGFYREYGDETLFPNTVHLGFWNGEEFDWDLLITGELPTGWQDENDGFVKFGARIANDALVLYANGVEIGRTEDEAPFTMPRLSVFGTSYENGMSNVGHIRAVGLTSIESITDEQLKNLTSID